METYFTDLIDKIFEITPEICEEFCKAGLNVDNCISLMPKLKNGAIESYLHWGPFVSSDGTHFKRSLCGMTRIGEPAFLQFYSLNEQVNAKMEENFDISIMFLFFNDDYEREWRENYDPYWDMRHILREIILKNRHSKQTFDYLDDKFKKMFSQTFPGLLFSEIEHQTYGRIRNY